MIVMMNDPQKHDDDDDDDDDGGDRRRKITQILKAPNAKFNLLQKLFTNVIPSESSSVNVCFCCLSELVVTQGGHTEIRQKGVTQRPNRGGHTESPDRGRVTQRLQSPGGG